MCPMFKLRHARNALLGCAALLMGIASAADGAPILSSGENLEVQRRSSGTPQYSVGQAQPATGFRVGFQSGFYPLSGNVGGIEAVYFFKLPAMPEGHEVGSATFSVSLLKPSVATPVTPGFNVDVYALGYETTDPPKNDNPPYGTGGVESATIAPAYFFAGPDQAPTQVGELTHAVGKIVDDMFTSTEFELAKTALNVPKTSSPLTDSALAQYIRNIYNDVEFTPGGYLVLRLTPDAAEGSVTSGTVRYQFPFAPETGGGTSYSETTYGVVTPPQIDITFVPVPEPAALGVLAAATLGMLRRRRR